MSSLPNKEKFSEQKIVNFFENYYVKEAEYPANEFDAVVGFFEKRSFSKEASIAVAQILLQQAKKEKIKIFKVLDTLKGLQKIQISKLVINILNANRDNTSRLGQRVNRTINQLEKRNIII